MTLPPVVLIADDEAICLAVTSRIVESAGLRVITAADGYEALRQYQRHCQEIQMVLLDIEMPGLNGVETFRRLKRIQDDVRVVIVSGHVTAANRAQIDTMRPAGYVDKPLTIEELFPLLEPLVKNSN